MQRIIEFLGYVLFQCPDNLIARLKYFKMINSLSYEKLDKLMGRDPERLTDWLRVKEKQGQIFKLDTTIDNTIAVSLFDNRINTTNLPLSLKKSTDMRNKDI